MNPAWRKFISLFLIFSLVIFSVNLFAKEWRGAKLIVTQKDGQRIECELLLVKMDSLILQKKFSANHITINIREIRTIKIVRESKALLGAGIGFLAGGSIGAFVGAKSAEESYGEWGSLGGLEILIGVGFLGIIGTLCGAGIGASEGTDIEIQIEGMTDLEIQKTLDKLHKKARFRYYEPYPKTEFKAEKEEKVEAAKLKIEVIVQDAVIRLWPKTDSEIVAKVSFGTVFTPERKVGEWYQVSFRDKSRFVLSGYIHESKVFVIEKIKKAQDIYETLDKQRKKSRIRDY